MSKNFYKQCRLTRGNITTVSWIPARAAVVGKVIGLKQENGTWDDGWTVTVAGTEPVEGKLVENQAHNSGNIWKPSTALTSRGNK